MHVVSARSNHHELVKKLNTNQESLLLDERKWTGEPLPLLHLPIVLIAARDLFLALASPACTAPFQSRHVLKRIAFYLLAKLNAKTLNKEL